MRKLKLQELNRISSADYTAAQKNRLVIMLDNIRSGHNVGAAFRTGDAMRVEEVVMHGITPVPPHREILKTALGADANVTWSKVDGLEYLQQKKAEGYKIYAIEQTDSSLMLQKIKRSENEPMVLIFGNEVKGVSNELPPLVDGAIEIPQFGTKHSFNVSVSMGIVLWELTRGEDWLLES